MLVDNSGTNFQGRCFTVILSRFMAVLMNVRGHVFAWKESVFTILGYQCQ